MSAPILVPRVSSIHVQSAAPGRGFWVMAYGQSFLWFPSESAAHGMAELLRQFAKVRLNGAERTVMISADHAAGHSTTCQDCERTCSELVDEIRKAFMEMP